MSDKLALTVGANPNGAGKLAVITRGGHPQYASDRLCEVLDVEIVPDMKAAKRWFGRMKIERPWETRQ